MTRIALGKLCVCVMPVKSVLPGVTLYKLTFGGIWHPVTFMSERAAQAAIRPWLLELVQGVVADLP